MTRIFILLILTSCGKTNSVSVENASNHPVASGKRTYTEGNPKILSMSLGQSWKYDIESTDDTIQDIFNSYNSYKSLDASVPKFLATSKIVQGYCDSYIDPSTGYNFEYNQAKLLKKLPTQTASVYLIKDDNIQYQYQNEEFKRSLDRMDLIILDQANNQLAGLNIFSQCEGSFAGEYKYFYISEDTIYLKTFYQDESTIKVIGDEKWIITSTGFKKI
jgi:hypothetical protein